MIGIICGCDISDRFGRKSALMYCSIISIIGGIGVTAAQNMAMLLVFRVFAGAGSFAFLALSRCFHFDISAFLVTHVPQHQDTSPNLLHLKDAVFLEP